MSTSTSSPNSTGATARQILYALKKTASRGNPFLRSRWGNICGISSCRRFETHLEQVLRGSDRARRSNLTSL